jgi:hypothetical protein
LFASKHFKSFQQQQNTFFFFFSPYEKYMYVKEWRGKKKNQLDEMCTHALFIHFAADA